MNMEELQKKIRYSKMYRNAIPFDTSQKHYHDAEILLAEMSKASIQSGKPISASFNGKNFVIGANTSMPKACEAFIDQTQDFRTPSAELLTEYLTTDREASRNNISNTHIRKIMKVKTAEALLTKYPQKADTLDTIQLQEVYLANFDNKKRRNLEPLLMSSIGKYISGEETFKPSVYNVAQLDTLGDIAVKSGMCSLEDFEKRRAKTEMDMLRTLESKKISLFPKESLVFVNKVAAKYPNDKTAKEVRDTTQTTLVAKDKTLSRN